MLEDYVAYYLDRYLGKYVKGLSKEALKVSVWEGHVELTNMQLKSEALNDLKLPIKVKAGFLGSVKLQVPWSRLGQEPVIVSLDNIFLLAEPAFKVEGSDSNAIQEARNRRVKDTETALLNAQHDNDPNKSKMDNSWLGSLIGTIIGNLKLSVTNIHIRYEDADSNPGLPFAAGFTLEKLAAVTVDESGNEIFVTGGALDRIQKFGEVKRLALYLDPDSKPWETAKHWGQLSRSEWMKIFEPGIKVEPSSKVDGSSVNKHHYLVRPVDGTASYYKLGHRETRTTDKPAQKAGFVLDDVTLCLSEEQYRDTMKLAENISAFNKRVQYTQYRPKSAVMDDKKSWWRYAYKAVLDQLKKTSGHLSWQKMLQFSQLRKKYVSLYTSCLQSNPARMSINDNKEIQELEQGMDTDVIVQWRMLAHAFVDQNRKAAQYEKEQSNKGWNWFGWGGQSDEADAGPKELNDNDLKKLNEAIGYEEGMESPLLPGRDPPDMIHTMIAIHMRHNASRLLFEDEVILELSAEGLDCGIKIYSETKFFDVKLVSYQIASPEGLLAESATHDDSINAQFTYSPFDKNVDWILSAKASPCYVTYMQESIDRVTGFFQSNQAVSREVALQTAAALQTTLDDVTRNAQQQINEALKNRPRFSLYLDIAAPKVTVPTDFCPDGAKKTKLLLDLGHFLLQSEQEDNPAGSLGEMDMYMRFRMNLNDVSAFLVDGDFDWHKQHADDKSEGVTLQSDKGTKYFSVLDKCGVVVVLDQICVPHTNLPPTRVSVRVPKLAFHLSPARYHRLMQVMKKFQSSSSGDENSSFRSWDPADFEGDISMLSWKGTGNREAIWQHRHGALAGPFLYILESPSSQSYEHRVSLMGKQILPLPPGSVGDAKLVLAICDKRQSKKLADLLSGLLLRFEDEEILDNWKNHLSAAIYQASASSAVLGMIESREKDEDKSLSENIVESEKVNPARQHKIFLIGALDELKISISMNKAGNHTPRSILLEDETLLLAFRACGSKVEYVMREHDMAVGAMLQSLEIEDKLQGRVSPSCHFLARSYISDMTKGGVSKGIEKEKKFSTQKSETVLESFFDSAEEFSDSDDSQQGSRRHLAQTSSQFYDAEESSSDDGTPNWDFPAFKHIEGLLPSFSNEDRDAISSQKGEQKNFVMAQVILSSADSPDYNNIDKEVRLCLSTLSFFCNRPTILALMDLGTDISAEVDTDDSEKSSNSSELVSTIDPKTVDGGNKSTFDRKDSVIRGLLGKGKDRVVFLLVLNMGLARVILNLEDGRQLATLSQVDLNVEVKIYPASFGIMAAIGNLQIIDNSLLDNSPYAWICDMRDTGGKSFVKLQFLSFNADDDDYDGYEYSLTGKLSEVRLVYLNRFIQEVVSYFMGLVPQDSKNVVKLKDRVTEVEKFFTQSEIEGTPAVKFDISLTKPIIILPHGSYSNDFMELDILQISVTNYFAWLGGGKDDLGAVRLETDVLQVKDLHLTVGVGEKTGDGIIKEANGLSVVLKRPLRDLWHKVPMVDTNVEVHELVAALSDDEYHVITECVVSNMAESPNLPPPLHRQSSNVDESNSSNEDQRKLETDKVQGSHENENENGIESSWTTINLIVNINLVELKLFHLRRDSPFATLQVRYVWAAYKSNSCGETFIASSLGSLSVRDDREGTEADLRYMIGMVDEFDHNSDKNSQDQVELNDQESTSCLNSAQHKCHLSMVLMDVKLNASSQRISIRVQRPRLLAALDFLLAFADFFVPSIKSSLSQGSDPIEALLDAKNMLYLSQSIYEQTSDTIILSPMRPLVADHEALDEYTYDGKGGKIRLLDKRGKDLHGFPEQLCIFIGHGKRLCFKNVTIQNGENFDACISLGSDSSYSASENNHVFFEGKPRETVDESMRKDLNFKGKPPPEEEESNKAVETIVEIQAIGPELVFCASSTRTIQPAVVNERLLRAKMSFSARFTMKEKDMDLDAQLKGLTIEAHSGVVVLEPVNLMTKYANVSGKQNIHLAMTDVVTNISFSVLQLVLKLQEDVMSFIRITSRQVTVECSEFDKIWADKVKPGEHQIAFWRPRVPPGFAVLGDCLTPLDEPPSKPVLALNTGLGHMKQPLDFVLVWSSSDFCSPDKNISQNMQDISDQIVESHRNGNHGSAENCSVWFPVAPPGYVALGCVVSLGKEPPQPSVPLCISAMLVTRWWMRDCIYINKNEFGKKGTSAFWRVDNSIGSFFPICTLPTKKVPDPYELRYVAFKLEAAPVKNLQSEAAEVPEEQNKDEIPERLICSTVTRFTLIWWDKGAHVEKHISIWRPVLPASCVLLGDFAVEGYEPPDSGLVLRNVGERVLMERPLNFEQIGRIYGKRGVKSVSFWFPIAPPGYVALGWLASRGTNLELKDRDLFRCVRSDLVTEAEVCRSSLWDSSVLKNVDEKFSLWPLQAIGNEAHTFVVTTSQQRPPRTLNLCLSDSQSPDTSENLEMDAEFKKITLTVFNDFGGLMAPLLNVSIDGIMASVNGRSNSMSATATFSLVATTYNGKCEAWEPLIESLDGFIRYNNGSDERKSLRESEVRIAATNDVNINLSNANVNMFIEAYSNWRNLDEKGRVSKDEDQEGDVKQVLEVEQKKLVKILCFNKLGERIFLRTVELDGQLNQIQLPFEGSATFKLPSESLRIPTIKKEAMQKSFSFAMLKLDEVELPEGDEVPNQQYLAAIRVLPGSYNHDQQDLKYQSARTRCLPAQKKIGGNLLARWNEIFLFQIEPYVEYSAEIIVADFVKGDTVGLCTIQLTGGVCIQMKEESNANLLKNLQTEWNPLHEPEKPEGEACGRIKLGYALFFVADDVKERPNKKFENLDPGTVQVGLSANGPWTKVSLTNASGTACLKVGNDPAACKISVQRGITHLIIRSFVVLKNNTNYSLEVSLLRNRSNHEDDHGADDEPSETSALGANKCGSDDENMRFEAVDEVFENERYQPFLGWGSSFPGHLLPTDPKRWSGRDLTGPEVSPPGELPHDRESAGDWHIDKSDSSHEDGWLYAFDFKNFSSSERRSFSESPLTFVRRRRWVRTRQGTSRTGDTRIFIGILKSGESIPLPVGNLQDGTPDYSVQMRPQCKESVGDPNYHWSHVVFCKGNSKREGRRLPAQDLSIHTIVGTEGYLSCLLKVKGSSTDKKGAWFCMKTTSTDIARDPYLGSIRDWKLIVDPPLKLMNILPVSAEYAILQSSKANGLHVRDRGLLTSGDTAEIYHADPQKPLYLSWFSQGGWRPKHEAILISHSHREVAQYITLRNSITGRKVRVHIAQDYEGKEIISKKFHIFVHFWLDCDRCPPLNLRLFELKPQDDKCLGMLSKRDPQPNFSDSSRDAHVQHTSFLEEIKHDELQGHPTMLSVFNARTMGLAAALASSNEEEFGPVSPLVDLDKVDGTVELKALDGKGFYFRLLVSTMLCPLKYAQTKVICIRPFTTFTNRLGEALFLKQTVNDQTNVLHPFDWRVSYPLPMSDEAENLQIRLEKMDWSYPFAIEKDESILVALRGTGRSKSIRVEIRGYEEGSRFLVVFRWGPRHGPYRIENRTHSIKIQFRQFGLDDNPWQQLLPNSTSSFSWEDPHGQQLLEIQGFGFDMHFSGTYDIDKVGAHAPLTCDQEPTICVNVQVSQLGDSKAVQFFEKELQHTQTEDSSGVLSRIGGMLSSKAEENYITNQLKLVLDVPKLGLSIIDQKPQEILFAILESVNLSYAMTSEQATSSLKLSIGYLQLDNQSIFSPLPVIITPERRGQFSQPVIRVHISTVDDNDKATKVYPFVGLWVTKSAWKINVHEPVIWELMEVYNNLHFDNLSGDQQVVQVDPEIRIDLIIIAELRLKLTLETAPEQRPPGMLGIWSPLLTTIGNTNKVPVHLSGTCDENRYMRQSAVTEAVWNHIRRDLVHHLLQVLLGFDVLGMASSTLGTLSKGAAELSHDDNFIKMKSKRDRFKQIGGVTHGFLQGSEALAVGVMHGVSGILMKPVTNARESGIIGFFRGLGKAAVGFVMQPISGVLDFVSLTVDGLSASCTRCYGLFSQEPTATRIRLPRAIRGDGIIRPYSEREAIGQAIMQLAEVHAVGHVFKETAKFALSDIYEDHFDLPKAKILVITNRRVMLLLRPKSLKLQSTKVLSEPCSVVWEVPFSELLALEVANAHNNQTPSHILLHIRHDLRTFARAIKCYTEILENGVIQAERIKSEIEIFWNKYGPDRKSLMKQQKERRHVYRTMPSPRASKRVSVGSLTADEAGKDAGNNFGTYISENMRDSSATSHVFASSSESHGTRIDSHRFNTNVMTFEQIWTSERDESFSCCNYPKEGYRDRDICSIWRPLVPNGYVSVGDIAYSGKNPPTLVTGYKNEKDMFASPSAYDLVWRSWKDEYIEPLTIWRPRPPEGYVSLGCVAVAGYLEPEPQTVWCAKSDITEEATVTEPPLWQAKSPWHCYLYQVVNESLTFLATREPREFSVIKPKRISTSN